MINALAIFNFENQKVRTIDIDGIPWFVARDITDPLGYADSASAVKRHCKHAKLFKSAETPELTFSNYGTMIIPESDLYRLVMKSKLPSAEAFEEWVTNEVLPSIRKTGSFTVPVSPELQLAQAVLLAQSIIVEQKLQIVQKDRVIAEIQPKAAIADKIYNSTGLFKFRAVAKMLEIREPVLREWLVSHGWMYYLSHVMTAKSAQLSAGYLKEKISLIKVAYDKEVSSVEMFFTPKGLHKLARAFGKELQLEMPMDMAA